MNEVKNRYRYELTTRLGVLTAEPLGEADFKIDWNLQDGEMLDYEKTLPSKMVFRNSVFTKLLKIERSIYRCDFIPITVERRCTTNNAESWAPWFSGRLSLNDGDWDLNRETVTLDLDEVKAEQCFIDNKTTEINLLQEVNTKYSVLTQAPNIEIEKVEYTTGGVSPCNSAEYWNGAGDPDDGGWRAYYHEFREPYSPGGDMVVDECFRLTKWARYKLTQPATDPSPGPEWILLVDGSPAGDSIYVKPAALYNCVYTYPDNGAGYSGFTSDCKVVGDVDSVVAIDNCMKFDDVVAAFIANFCAGITVKSQFLQINPDTVTPINYVTGAKSKTNNLFLAQKSDVKRPTASGNATIAKWTFEKLLNAICTAYNLKWRFVGTVLRIEHVSWFSQSAGFNLTLPKYAKYVREMERYSYDTEKIPAREIFKFKEASGGDFEGLPIIYSGGCVSKASKDNVKTYAIDDVTTDVELCLSHPESDSQVVDDQGFVLIATYTDGDVYWIITENGILGGEHLNNSLAWAQLHRDYHRYYRPLASGNMNGTDTDFYSVKPTKKGASLKIPLTCLDTFNPDDIVTTALGSGTVDKASFSFKDEMLELDLLYPANVNLTTNTAPVAVNDVATTYKNEPKIIDVLANDSEPDSGGSITGIVIVTPPIHGTVTITADNKVLYTPAADYVGDDLFIYTAVDEWNEPSNNALVSITVLPGNTGPVAVDDDYTTDMDTPLIVPAAGVLDNDSDDVGFSLQSFDAVSANGGTVAMDPDGSFTYTPPAGFSGLDTFTYTIEDEKGLTSTATVTIDVVDPDAPIAVDDEYTTLKNTVLTVEGADADNLTANDTLVGLLCKPVSVTKATAQGGTVQIFVDSGFIYTPPTGFTGDDSFTYTLKNQAGKQDIATVTVHVLELVYARLQRIANHVYPLTIICDGDETAGGTYSEARHRVYFYSDAAMTIPVSVTGLTVNVLKTYKTEPGGPDNGEYLSFPGVNGFYYDLFGGVYEHFRRNSIVVLPRQYLNRKLLPWSQGLIS